jgi:hypothetical protein
MAQTRPPDEYVFIVKDLPGSNTRHLLHELCPKIPQLSYAIDHTPFIPRHERNFHAAEHVYSDFAWRRNKLRQMVLKREPDVFLSLDTDIMLEDETVVERLLGMLDDAPVASVCTFLHPAGRASECFNAGFWTGGDPGSPDRAWRRATPIDAAMGTIQIDIPMAVVAMKRRIVETCQYRHHAQGEDCGFAQDLDRLGVPVLWNADIEARHVMSEDAL